jgi:OMF family outer membrane factor
MNAKAYPAAVALALVCASAAADAEQAASLPNKLSLALACALTLENNPGIKSVREQLVEQDGVLKEARSRMLPSLSASATYDALDDNRLQSFGEGFSADSSRWGASLDAFVPLYAGGRNYHYIQGAKARRRSIGSGLEATEQDLLVLVHGAYYQAWLADRRVEVRKEAVSVFEQQLQVARNMFAAGAGERYDVTQAEVALATARPPLIRATNDRRRSLDRLQEIVGLPYPEGADASGIELQDLGQAGATDMVLKDAIASAMRNRPEVARVRHDLEAARRDLKLAKRELSPTVSIGAGYAIESDLFGTGSDLEGWHAGVRLNWDVYDGGRRGGRTKQARSKVRQVEHRSAELALSIEAEVRKAYYDQQEAAAILEASSKTIIQAREALRLAQNKYKAGNGTQLEVLESQLQLMRTQLAQSTARHDMALAAVQMKRATGARIIRRQP